MTNKKGQVVKSWGNHIIQPWAESGHYGAWASLHILCHSWSAKEATARPGGSRGWLACLLRKVLSPRQLVPQLQTNPVQVWPSSGLTLSPHGPWCQGSSTSSLGSGFCWAPCDKRSDAVRPAPCLSPHRAEGRQPAAGTSFGILLLLPSLRGWGPPPADATKKLIHIYTLRAEKNIYLYLKSYKTFHRTTGTNF